MRFFKKTISVLLVLVLLLTAFSVSFSAFAVTYPCEGFVTGTSVNMRSDAGTGYKIVTVTTYQQELTVKGEKKGTDGYVWYSVTLDTGENGYIRSDFVHLKKSAQEFNRTGVVIRSSSGATTTTMYDAPGTWNNVVVSVPIGTKATIYEKDYDADGDMWYYSTVTIGGKTYKGYLFNTRVEITVDYEYDEEFENYLTKQGFPESYKERLRSVHAQYPNWVFIADHVNLSWQKAMEYETKLGWSLTDSGYEAWRSMKAGAYNWGDKSYIALDSGAWYAAHDDVVAYYLDPRNFLNVNSIFQFIGMSFDKNLHNKEALQNVLEGTFMEGNFPEKHDTYKTWADVLFAASEKYGMSPYALAAMILLEQGTNGSGASISGTVSGYKGYYNFLNIKAYQNGDISAIQNGMIYASSGTTYSRPWDNRLDSIFGGTEFYVHEYISNGQDTLYYKKFNVIKEPYASHQYMTNIRGADIEGGKTKSAYDLMLDAALVFKIPVYSNMPESPAAYPTTTGNNNYYLDSITVDGFSLSPDYNLYNNTYELVVKNSVEKVKVSATAKDSNAVVNGTGTYALKEGVNTIEISVVATSGRTNVYKVIIDRAEGSGQAETTFSKDKYTFSDNTVSDVAAGTTASAFITNLAVKNGSAVVINSSGEQNNSIVCTGDVVQIKKADGSLLANYHIAVKGDVSGDGKISLLDLSKVQRHLLQIEEVVYTNALAADVSGDGKVSLLDLSIIQRHLLQIESIK